MSPFSDTWAGNKKGIKYWHTIYHLGVGAFDSKGQALLTKGRDE